MTGKIDWDGETYCAEACGRKARYERIYGMTDDEDEMVELVCFHHAHESAIGVVKNVTFWTALGLVSTFVLARLVS